MLVATVYVAWRGDDYTVASTADDALAAFAAAMPDSPAPQIKVVEVPLETADMLPQRRGSHLRLVS